MKIAFPAEMISDINMQYQKLLILMTGSSAPTAEIIPAFTMMLNRPRVIRVRGSDIICSPENRTCCQDDYPVTVEFDSGWEEDRGYPKRSGAYKPFD